MSIRDVLKREIEKKDRESEKKDRDAGEQKVGEQGSEEQGSREGEQATCAWLTVEKGDRRCVHYRDGGACGRPDVFMCRLWAHANRNGVARGYHLEDEPDPFETEADAGERERAILERAQAMRAAGEATVDPFEAPDEPDPFEAPQATRRGSMNDPDELPERPDEAGPTELDQLTIPRVPNVPPPKPFKRRSRVAGAVKGGRGRGGRKVVVRPPPEPPRPPPTVEPASETTPSTPSPFAGTVEPEDVARLEALGFEVEIDGWGTKPVRLTADETGETEDGVDLSFRDAASIANVLHAFPGARVTGIRMKKKGGSE